VKTLGVNVIMSSVRGMCMCKHYVCLPVTKLMQEETSPLVSTQFSG